MQTVTLSSLIVRRSEVISADAGDEVLMMSIENGEYYGIQGAGSSIWESMAEPVSIETLCRQIMEEYKVDEETCQSDVIKFVTKLLDSDIVEIVT